MAPPTIISLKQAFLTTQTRLLSQPLAPSRAWLAANTNADAGDAIPERVLEDALVRANQALLQHERRVHPPQATHHVAEQIDQLYWNAGERDAVDGAPDGEDGFLSESADLADPDTIASLPPTWPSERDVAAHPIDGQRFAALVCRLQELAAERAEASATVVRLRRMCEALEPFRPRDAGGGGGVQENLVTRNGEMEGELERMRTLLARVCGRVAALKAGEPGAQAAGEGLPMDVDVMRVADQKKADKLLQMLGHAGVQYNDTAPPP